MLIESRFNYRLDDQATGASTRSYNIFARFSSTKKKARSDAADQSALSELQKKFILAREIGYQVLGLKERAMTSAPERVDSFEQVLNDFKASYFAGALLSIANRRLPTSKNFSRSTDVAASSLSSFSGPATR